MKIGHETVGTPGDGYVESPRDALRDTDHMFFAQYDNREVDACNHHEFVAPCDNFVASHTTQELILMLLSF